MQEEFADMSLGDYWMTRGWSRGPEDRWIELGSSVKTHPAPADPELGIHQVAEKLNYLEHELSVRTRREQEMEAEVHRLQQEIARLQAVER